MSAKSHGQRVFILVIVVVFFLTSLGFSGMVVWDQLRNKDESAETSDLQKQLEEQLKQQENQEGKLEGTKLEGYTPVEKVDALQSVDLTVGTGKEAAASSTVTAHYTGALAKDGTIFESSKDTGEPATFPLAQVIQGWQQGVPGMKEGGKRRLIIPASLAYGERGSPPKIGPNEPLVFDIELTAVQ